MSISAYPLQWPQGWKCTAKHNRKAGRFLRVERQYRTNADGSQNSWQKRKDLSVTDAVARVLDELQRMGVDRQDVVISTNVRSRLDGLPRSGEPEPDNPGAAVYWQEALGARRVMAIDSTFGWPVASTRWCGIRSVWRGSTRRG